MGNLVPVIQIRLYSLIRHAQIEGQPEGGRRDP